MLLLVCLHHEIKCASSQSVQIHPIIIVEDEHDAITSSFGMKCTLAEETITSPERRGTNQHGDVYA